ncbi:flagellar export protein FliJ [Vibrio genomosp. F10]|uniref:Flagellar FliJ protein n=2 Tax=Vibrio genomosp. F10 TaxID=723171 RepID=A0A1B9QWR4_9VIBR|nr:flagellar export protein FliJ [Vibrio genomosp. F10]OCH74118.1 flagellar protein FliJ [Vibrio genomosp. F10]OEE35403.1 flagellar protein FliJ [Vibrio genomosp. F10 str. ZF-129]OEE91296.1 flagellar protein FliJ [Vibrio genomosp. F10 str. 9ZD137]OEE94453.1 flagellar protein FliJ [Vibrio genomosp. F10 str. 9ZC157]OEF04683.1 flagellar protein FliJ [Vibrio genomosp. F10 str. 9ZB36]
MENALGFLLEQSKDRENQAVLALNQANAELNNYYEQLSQIEKYRLDYCQQLIDRGKEGLTASQYGHLNRFLTQLDETLAKQKQAESHFKSQVDNCQAHWLEVRKQRRSYEWLLEKKQTEKQKLQEIREQKQLDEFSTLQFSRNKSNKDLF